MIVNCENCAARYKLDDAKISGRGAKITCPRCRHVFVVYRSSAQEADETPSGVARVKASPPSALPPASSFEVSLPPRTPAVLPAPIPPPVEPPTPPPRERALTSGGLDVHALDFRKVGIQSWKVKVKIGLIYDFSDYKTLRKYIQDGRVTPADLLSHDGRNWTPIGDLPDLERHFVEVYEEHDRRRAAAREAEAPAVSGFEEETPTMIVGMSEVVDSLAARLAANESPVPPPPTGAPRKGGGLSAPAAVAPPGPAPGAVFTDPFEDMKERQRGRMAARRAEKKTRAEEPAESSGMSPLWLVLLGLVAVGVGSWLYVNREPARPAAAPVETPAAPADGAAGAGAEDIREKLRAELEAELKSVESEPDPIRVDEPAAQLIPVRPSDAQIRSSPGSSANSTPTTASGTPSTDQFSASPITARDHADAGDDAWRRAAWREAAQAFEAALGLEPNNGQYALKLGRARYKSGDYSGARQVLTKASQYGQVEASKWLGHIARDQGDTAGAIGHYNTYLKSTPSDAGEIQREIDALTGS